MLAEEQNMSSIQSVALTEEDRDILKGCACLLTVIALAFSANVCLGLVIFYMWVI